MIFLPPLNEYEDEARDRLPYRGEAQCYVAGDYYGTMQDAYFHGTEQELMALLLGGGVEVYGANRYSHRDVLVPTFEKVEITDWTSSAGDWDLAVFDGENWMFGWQESMYPYGGMRVGVDNSMAATTLDELYRCYDYV